MYHVNAYYDVIDDFIAIYNVLEMALSFMLCIINGVIMCSNIMPFPVIMPPFEKGGAYCVAHVGPSVCLSVSMSVSLNLVQLITQEGFAPEASNLVGR